MYVYLSVIHGYIDYPFICICENRSGLCMHATVRDGDGSALCARVGGLVLRARPEPETLNRASPCPSASTALRLRRAGVLLGVGVQREHRRLEHRGCHRLFLCMRRSRPGGAHYGRRALPGFGVARPVVRGGTADARTRAHVPALACAGPWV